MTSRRSERRFVAGVPAACLALFAEGAGDLPAGSRDFLAEPGVFLLELAAFGVGGFQAAQQGGVGGALGGWDRRGRRAAGRLPQPDDVIADVGLGIQP